MQMVFKAENLLVDVVNQVEVAGVTRYQVRDASDRKAPVRTVLASGLREVEESDINHIIYLYTDEETGEVHSLKLQKDFISAVPVYLNIGKHTAITTKDIISRMHKQDTDSNRRQFRAAVAYWIERGIIVCSTSSGYFIAGSGEEVTAYVSHKEKQANANLKRAKLLSSMNVENSLSAFQSERLNLNKGVNGQQSK